MAATASVRVSGSGGDNYYKYTPYETTDYVVRTRTRTTVSKEVNRPIEYLAVQIGGPFEQVGGGNETVGGSNKKMG